MTDSVLDIPAVTKKIGDAADAAAAAAVTGGEAQKVIATRQAELTVALHEQTARNVDRALQASGESALKATGFLIDAAVQKIHTQTDEKIMAAASPLSKTLDELMRLVRSVAESNGQAVTDLAGTVTRAHGELKEQIANLAKVTTELATAHRDTQQYLTYLQSQSWPSQPPHQGQTGQTSYEQPNYEQTYPQGYGQSYPYWTGENTTSTSSTAPSTSADVAMALAQAAAAVAEHTRLFSAVTVTPEAAVSEWQTMHKHLENLETALRNHGSAADDAHQLVADNKVTNAPLEEEWRQELVHAFIGGITSGPHKMTGLDLVGAYQRLMFLSASTMRDAVAHDERLWQAWAGAVAHGWSRSRETTLVTHVHDGAREVYLIESGGGAVFVWDVNAGAWVEAGYPQGSSFRSFVAAAPKVVKAHERSNDGDKILLEYLYQLYQNGLSGTIEMVTSIGMCASCTMVALQLLHRCPDLKINVRVTYVPDGHGGKTAFYQLTNAGMILSTALAVQAPSSRDGDPLIKKQKLEEQKKT